MEAFAYGTPVIGTRIGGIPELVSDGETGFLCECGSPASLAEAMIRATAMSAEEYKSMQDRCRNYVTKECSRQAYFRLLNEVYQNAIRWRRRDAR